MKQVFLILVAVALLSAPCPGLAAGMDNSAPPPAGRADRIAEKKSEIQRTILELEKRKLQIEQRIRALKQKLNQLNGLGAPARLRTL